MANVEVQLDVKAEYKQALAAIATLSKALDAVQQRAKVALSVSGGAQGGADGAGKAEAEQKAAVEALSAAMKDAAAAAAMLTESVSKLTPALEAMGPQAAQVQQVLTLAEHYKQLAAAMDIAADAAAKYNASGAQQGEIDARIRKLMEENQRLMDLIASIREEYAAVVRRNAELNRANKERKESTKAVKEELEVTQDLSYQMQLAAMTKRELVAEIERLTKARKEAAKAGDEARYQELTEELKLARQAMAKLRQEQQLSKIAYLQQAQAAQSLASNIKNISEGFSNLGDSAKNGTLNLTGMASSIASLHYQIKGGIGPISAAILALELLQSAWNLYAKTAKRTEDAEMDVQETMRLSTKAYEDAAEAKQRYLEQKERESEINQLKEQYVSLNDEIERGVQLLEQTKNEELARLSLTEDAAKHDETLKKAELGRQLSSGQISQTEYEKALIELSRQSKERQANDDIEKSRVKTETASSRLSEAQKAYSQKEALAHEQNMYLAQFASEDELETMHGSLEELKKRRDERQKKLREALRKQKNQVWGGMGGFDAIELQNEIDSLRTEVKAADRALLDYETFIEDKLGTDDIKGYSKKRAHAKNKADIANRERETAASEVARVQAEVQKAKEDLNTTITRAQQEIAQAKEIAKSEIATAETKEAARKKKEAEKAQKQAAEAAKKEAERRAEITSAAAWQIDSANRDRLTGASAADVKWLLEKGMKDAQDGALSAKNLERLLRAWDNAQTSKTSADNDLVKLVASMVKKLNGASRDQRRRLEALQKNQI